jgi:hypothetical protein
MGKEPIRPEREVPEQAPPSEVPKPITEPQEDRPLHDPQTPDKDKPRISVLFLSQHPL